jgi:predicted nucleic acid-binding protein
MPAARLIADAGPLIALAKVELLDLSRQLYRRITIPVCVYQECLTSLRLPDAHLIDAAVAEGWIEVLDNAPWPDFYPPPSLNRGEKSVIALAVHLRARVLMDDLRGRRAALQMGVPLIGLCGVLLVAKERRLVQSVAEPVDRLSKPGYFISPPVRKAVLLAAGELVG